MTAIEITQKYFEASNRSDFSEIETFFRDSSTYSSQNTWIFLWKVTIIEMQRNFHTSFEKLSWTIDAIEEVKPGIVKVDFTFSWVKNWEVIMSQWIEYVVIYDWYIQHVEIRMK